MGHEVIPEARIETPRQPRNGQMVQVRANEAVRAAPQADRLADETPLATLAADAFTQTVVRIAGEPQVAGGGIIQHERVDAIVRSGQLAQGFEVKPHNALDAAFVRKK